LKVNCPKLGYYLALQILKRFKLISLMAQRKPEPEMKELLKRIYGCSKDNASGRKEESGKSKKAR